MLALLQFDASSLPVVQRLMAEGRLPALSKLSEDGLWHPLELLTDLFEPYASVYSGVEVGEHGLYYFFLWVAEEQRVRYVDDRPSPETAWEHLCQRGGRALVIDPFHAPRPSTANGVFVSGWQFRHKMIPQWSVPRGVSRALARRFGRPPLVETTYGRRSTAELLAQRRCFLAGPGRAAAAVAHLLEQQRFDLVWVNFIESHQAGHLFWESPGEEPAHRGVPGTLEDVYRAIDDAIGRITSQLPAGSSVIVFSPMGMGHNTSRADLLPDMLAAVLEGKRPHSSKPSGAPGSAIWRVRGATSTWSRAAVTRPLPGSVARRVVSRLYSPKPDWRETRAFVVPGDQHGYVRLNLRGREREGIVDPSAADELTDEIADGLTGFRDPDGSPAVAAVERVRELIDGAQAGQLPDLVVRWSDRSSVELTGVTSPVFGDVRRHGEGAGHVGNHTFPGWALIVPGSSSPHRLDRSPQLVDIAATACALAGKTNGMAGVPLLEFSDSA